MATIDPTEPQGHLGTQTKLHQWATVTENDSCTPVRSPAAAEKSVQLAGSFGGGNVPIEGSIDGTNYVTLADIAGDSMAVSAAGIFTIRDNVQYVRPGTPTGTSVSVTVTLLHKQVS